MKMKIILLAFALCASTSLLTAQDAKPPGGGQGGPGGGKPGPHLLPRGADEKLNLTADQKKAIDELEAEVKSKLEKILTPEQLDQLKQMRPPGGGKGPSGKEGPPPQGGGKGKQGGGPQGGPGAGAPKRPAAE
jgi:Spy/CpxP family protein refolding chaperone